MKDQLEYLILNAEKITQAAAISCLKWIGKGNEKQADASAVTSMRQEFNKIDISGTVVIGEGERDKAPMLFIGEKLGKGGIALDIAVDPLEGTTLCAHAANNSISALTMAESGTILNAPDVYMKKIAVGPNLPDAVIDLDDSCTENLKSIASAKGCRIDDLWVTVLNRQRHDELIEEIRMSGAKIKLIQDGDVMGVLEASLPNAKTDMYIGIGGAPEGVLAAAALKCFGGQMQTRLVFENDEQKKRAKNMGINNPSQKYQIDDMIRGEVIFSATGITDGFLQGVKNLQNNKFFTDSIVISSITKSFKRIQTCSL